MKTIAVSARAKTLNDLLKKARGGAVVLESADGQRFALTAVSNWEGFDVGVSNDFADEVERTGSNKKLMAAEREERRIAVEIKSFQGSSDVSEFHTALGQFLNYRYVIGKTMPERTLYLAIPVEAFAGFFQEPDVQEIVQTHRIKLLVYDAQGEEILQWID